MISLILPTYNEVDNIIPLLKALGHVLKTDYELIVVDDNSPDGTSESVTTFIHQQQSQHVRLETRMHDHGLTKSIQHGINVSRGNIVGWMDCDFSMPPEYIPRLVKKVQGGYDAAVGSRFIAGGKQKISNNQESKLAIFFSTLINTILRLLLAVDFHDFTSGFIVIKKDVITSFPLQGEYGEYFIDLTVRLKRAGIRIAEVPYANAPRHAGVSKTLPNLKTFFVRSKQYGGTVLRLLFAKKTP